MSKEYVYEKEQVGKYTVKVVQDTDPLNPRTDWDNLATMVCFHRRYDLGDKHSFTDPQDEDLVSLLKRKDVIWLPLYLYDHSGITMNTGGFSCPWDSGQVGVIYIEKETYRKAFSCKKVNTKKVYDLLRSEVKDYDNYLTGSVYGFMVEDENGETVDSCWGFFGDSKDCLEEGIAVARWRIKDDLKKHIEKVKTWIRNRVPLEKRMVMICKRN